MNRHSTDMFLHATGGTGPFCITVESASQGPQVYSNAGWRRQFKFDQPFVLVGSHERADLRLDSDAISRRQVYLQLLNGRVFATSLSSRIPTFWGTLAQPSGWVEPGGSLRIGPYILRFDAAVDSEADGAVPENPLAPESFSGEPVILSLRNGRSGADEAVINRMLTLVGHAPPCKLIMKSSRVSAIHCSLVRTEEGLWVTDLASREGVQINGQDTRSALLAEGDLMEIGGRRIVVRYGARPVASVRPKRIKIKNRPAPRRQEPPPRRPEPPPPPPEEPVNAEPQSDLVHVGDEPAQLHSLDEVEQWIPISALEPLFDRMNEMQAQTYQQFQEIMNAMIMSFGSMFMEHREFVGQEIQKLEQLVRALTAIKPTPEPALPARAEPAAEAQQVPAPAAAAPPAESAAPAQPAMPQPANQPMPQQQPVASPATPRPRPAKNGNKVPSGDEFHIWIAQRISQLSKQRSNRWDGLLAALRSKVGGHSVE